MKYKLQTIRCIYCGRDIGAGGMGNHLRTHGRKWTLEEVAKHGYRRDKAGHLVPLVAYELAARQSGPVSTPPPPSIPDQQPNGLRISEEAMRIAISGLEKIQAEIASHISDCKATLDAPLVKHRRPYRSSAELANASTEGLDKNTKQSIYQARYIERKKAGLVDSKSAPIKRQDNQVAMEYWPNGEPKYLTNTDGSVRLTRFGKPWKRIRQGMAQAAAIKSHVARGLKPTSALKKAQDLVKHAGVAKPHTPVDPRSSNREVIQ